MTDIHLTQSTKGIWEKDCRYIFRETIIRMTIRHRSQTCNGARTAITFIRTGSITTCIRRRRMSGRGEAGNAVKSRIKPVVIRGLQKYDFHSKLL